MAVRTNQVVQSTLSGLALREIDFVSRFSKDMKELLDVLGISRPIYKENGSQLYKKSVATTLANQPTEGDLIDLSQQAFTESAAATITIKKYAKSLTLEVLAKNGEVWADKSDDSFLHAIENVIVGDFFTYLATGSGVPSGTPANFQDALAQAAGAVEDFNLTNNLGGLGKVAFVNVEDAYAYLGAQTISLQMAFGMNYIKNFLGYDAVFFCSSSHITAGTVIAVDKANLSLYAVNPASSLFVREGLDYTIDEYGLIGVHKNGNYGRAASDTYAIMGIQLFAEYLAGVVVATF